MKTKILETLLNNPEGMTVDKLAMSAKLKKSDLEPTLEQMFSEQELYFTPAAETWHHPLTCDVVQATEASAGGDCVATATVVIPAGEMLQVESTLTIPDCMPEDAFILATARSSMYKNHKLILVNGVGIIDEDYPGRVLFQYLNMSSRNVVIEKGMKVGQGVCIGSVERVWPIKAEKRTSGIGSTGD